MTSIEIRPRTLWQMATWLFLPLVASELAIMPWAAAGEAPERVWQKRVFPQPAGAADAPAQAGRHPAAGARRIAWYAQPSRQPRDSAGYVGGNAVWRGQPRDPTEGTWGLDYAGYLAAPRIWLKWLHGGPSHQPGGSYDTDGPHFLAHE